MNDKIKAYKSMMFWRNVCVYSPFIVIATVAYLISRDWLDGAFAIIMIFIYCYVMRAILLVKSLCPFCGECFYKSDLGHLFTNSFALLSNHCQHCGEPKSEGSQ